MSAVAETPGAVARIRESKEVLKDELNVQVCFFLLHQMALEMLSSRLLYVVLRLLVVSFFHPSSSSATKKFHHPVRSKSWQQHSSLLFIYPGSRFWRLERCVSVRFLLLLLLLLLNRCSSVRGRSRSAMMMMIRWCEIFKNPSRSLDFKNLP